MPKGTKVHRCVQHVMDDGKEKGSAIAICQSSTGLSYKTGKKPKKKIAETNSFNKFLRKRDSELYESIIDEEYYKWSEYNCPFCGGTALNGEPYRYHPEGPFWFRGSARCQDCNESFSAIRMEPKGTLFIEKNKWIQKAVDPEHKGYCTPMTKKTCTPRRKALAKRFKKGDIHKENLKRGDNPKGKG